MWPIGAFCSISTKKNAKMRTSKNRALNLSWIKNRNKLSVRKIISRLTMAIQWHSENRHHPNAMEVQIWAFMSDSFIISKRKRWKYVSSNFKKSKLSSTVAHFSPSSAHPICRKPVTLPAQNNITICKAIWKGSLMAVRQSPCWTMPRPWTLWTTSIICE